MDTNFPEGFKGIPASWEPRRPQPSWDRTFTGKADIVANFKGKTDKWNTWMREAAAFSMVLKEGLTEQELKDFGVYARAEVAKTKRLNGK